MGIWCKVKPVMLKCNPSELCQRAYPNHPKGCPNHGKRETCPPQAPMWDKDIMPVYAICNIFDFGLHVRCMRERHPEWSQRQVECCLYWQGTARKELRETIEGFRIAHNECKWTVHTCPEAMGVDITATMAKVDEHLEWPPVTEAWQVALAVATLDKEKK